MLPYTQKKGLRNAKWKEAEDKTDHEISRDGKDKKRRKRKRKKTFK
jgi:hypothetical protein